MSTFEARIGMRRRLRLSFDFKLFIEPRECFEPCDQAVLWEPRDPEDMFVKPVSRDESEGALKTEKLSELLFEDSCW